MPATIDSGDQGVNSDPLSNSMSSVSSVLMSRNGMGFIVVCLALALLLIGFTAKFDLFGARTSTYKWLGLHSGGSLASQSVDDTSSIATEDNPLGFYNAGATDNNSTDGGTTATGTVLTENPMTSVRYGRFFGGTLATPSETTANDDRDVFDFASIYDNESVSSLGSGTTTKSKILSGKEKQMKMIENYQRVQMINQRENANKKANKEAEDANPAPLTTSTPSTPNRIGSSKESSKTRQVSPVKGPRDDAPRSTVPLSNTIAQSVTNTLKSLRHVKRSISSKLKSDEARNHGPGVNCSDAGQGGKSSAQLSSGLSGSTDSIPGGGLTLASQANGLGLNSDPCMLSSPSVASGHSATLKAPNQSDCTSIATGASSSTAPLWVDADGPWPVFDILAGVANSGGDEALGGGWTVVSGPGSNNNSQLNTASSAATLDPLSVPVPVPVPISHSGVTPSSHRSNDSTSTNNNVGGDKGAPILSQTTMVSDDDLDLDQIHIDATRMFDSDMFDAPGSPVYPNGLSDVSVGADLVPPHVLSSQPSTGPVPAPTGKDLFATGPSLKSQSSRGKGGRKARSDKTAERSGRTGPRVRKTKSRDKSAGAGDEMRI